MAKYSAEMRRTLLALRERTVGGCELCGGRGFVATAPSDTTGVAGYTRCRCDQVFRYLKELTAAEIPIEYWQLYWRELHVDDVYKSIVELYFDNFHNAVDRGLGLFFLGNNGVGKTAMMCEVGKEAVVRGVLPVLYYTVQRFITATMHGDRFELDRIASAKVLLLDEVDKAYMKEGSEFVPKTVEDLLRRKLATGSVVVAASNENDETLTEMFGESTMSLLRRKLKLVPIAGSDFSDELQSGWVKSLKATYDLYHPHIVAMARRKDQNDYEEVR